MSAPVVALLMLFCVTNSSVFVTSFHVIGADVEAGARAVFFGRVACFLGLSFHSPARLIWTSGPHVSPPSVERRNRIRRSSEVLQSSWKNEALTPPPSSMATCTPWLAERLTPSSPGSGGWIAPCV